MSVKTTTYLSREEAIRLVRDIKLKDIERNLEARLELQSSKDLEKFLDNSIEFNNFIVYDTQEEANTAKDDL